MDERSGCEYVKRNLKPFLDDMLLEEDYLECARHLEQCPKCRDYVASIGALSNQLYALGEIVRVPEDFSSTVLFRLSAPPEPKKTDKKNHYPLVLGVSAAAMLFSAALGFIALRDFRMAHSPRVKEAHPVKAAPAQPVEEDVQKEPSAPPAAEEEAGEQSASVPERPPELVPLHWHVALSDDGEKWMAKTLEMMSVRFLHKSRFLYVISIRGEDMRKFREAVSLKFPLIDYTGKAYTADGRESELSIFLSRPPAPPVPQMQGTLVSLESARDTVPLHWHIFMLLSKKAELLDCVRQAGGLQEYESAHTLVFRLNSREAPRLAEKIGALEGVSAQIDAKALSDAAKNEKVELILYVTER